MPSASTPRSKRSTTNLANLRLAPLSEKFSAHAPTIEAGSLDDGNGNDAFAKLSASHRSAPTSPRVLSRSSSSRRFFGGGPAGGGISRRSSLYDADREGDESGYSGIVEDETRLSGKRLAVSGARVPKAKSEAALGVPAAQQQRQQQRQRLAGKGERVKRRSGLYDGFPSSRSLTLSRSARASGTTTPRVRVEDDWLTRTGQAASSVLQEQKGQSFLSSRHAALRMGIAERDLTDDEDEDEGYEELAALSASRSGFAADDELSPVSTRASRWGSRYGSRRTSRRGSVVLASGSRTPLASAQAHPAGGAGQEGYFDPVALPVEPDFMDEEGGSSTDDEQRGLLSTRFSSLGGLVDRLIGIRLFDVDEGRETSTESETEREGEGETEGEARKRIDAEVKRRREEKERLRDAQEKWRFGMGGDGEGAGWEDARWLFGRAREAWM